VRLLASALANLHDELAGLGELQNLIFVPLPADPDEALRVDVDAVFRRGPVITGTIAAPALDVVAVLIELHHRRSRPLPRPHDARPMENPDVILLVRRGAGHLAQHPAVGNLGPAGHYFELRDLLGDRGTLR